MISPALKEELEQLRASLDWQRKMSEEAYSTAVTEAKGYAQRITELGALVAELNITIAGLDKPA